MLILCKFVLEPGVMKDYTKLTDHELASLLSENSEAAFKVIYNRFWKKLLAIAGRRRLFLSS